MENSARGQIIEEAKRRGIKVIAILDGIIDLFNLEDHTEYLCKQFISKTSAVATYITNNKEVTKVFLQRAGLNVPRGKAYDRDDFESAEREIEKLNWPLIIKPTASAKGDSVFTNISTTQELSTAWQQVAQKHQKILIEEMFEGQDYRIFALPEKVIAITQRIPANVIGDGKKTIKELIEEKNGDEKRLVKIQVDEIAVSFLEKSGFALDSVLEKDKLVFLRKNANISTGGDIVDVTDNVHESVKTLAIKAIKAVPGLAYGGVDLMSKDVTIEQNDGNYTILEINASASIKMHHFPTTGKPRNVAKEIVDIMFPETI